MFGVLDGPIEPLGAKANGLSEIVDPGGGPVAKYAAPKIRVHILDLPKPFTMVYIIRACILFFWQILY